MRHIFFSPHLDDAVLCCGGMMAKFIAAGDGVAIHTVFCGHAAPPYSPLAAGFHEQWGDPKDMVRLRRAEDVAAAAKLGAEVIHGNWQEPIYRTDEQGQWLYHEVADIFGARHPADDMLVKQLIEEIGGDETIAEARLYFPLGVGRHVDHMIMFEVGQALAQKRLDVVFYEDFPYAARGDSFERRIAELPELEPAPVPFGQAEMDAKVGAFLYYRSQIEMLFQSSDNVRVEFMTFAHSVSRDGQSFSERLWFVPE